MNNSLLKLLYQIISGKKYATIGEKKYIYRSPTEFEIYNSLNIYEETFLKDVDAGVLTNEQLLKILNEDKIWTKKNEDNITKIQEELRYLSEQLIDYQFQINKVKMLKIQIDDKESELLELINKKNNLLINTAEFNSSVAEKTYIVSKITLDENMNQFFIDENIENNLMHQLIVKYYSESIPADKDIRFLARNEPWRTMWLVGKKSGNIFDIPSVCLNDEQRRLCMWSAIYDNIYESSECPDADIINDDYMIDSWLQKQSKKYSKGSINTDKYGKGQEIFITADAEGARKVYALNSPESRKIIRDREKQLDKKGEIPHVMLKDVNQKMKQEFIN